MDCDDGAFLNATSDVVADWLCQTCPPGGDCTNSFEFKDTGRRWKMFFLSSVIFALTLSIWILYAISTFILAFSALHVSEEEMQYGDEYWRSGASMKDSLDFNRTRNPERYCSMKMMDECERRRIL